VATKRHGLQWVCAQRIHTPGPLNHAHEQPDHHRYRALADTQTGLRGFPAHLLPWLLRVPGDRYEYELQQLLLAVREEVPPASSSATA
jgi:hypothetical protein